MERRYIPEVTQPSSYSYSEPLLKGKVEEADIVLIATEPHTDLKQLRSKAVNASYRTSQWFPLP